MKRCHKCGNAIATGHEVQVGEVIYHSACLMAKKLEAEYDAKTYIGDSVYVSLGAYHGEVVLTTENGFPDDPSNKIVLGPGELISLRRYLESKELW